jgi:hypothetical protein
MLEQYLAEIKHQEESKLQHPEPLACTKFLHTTLHCENRKAPAPDANSKPAWETFSKPTGQLVGYRADIWNLRTNHTSLREELTKQLLLKDKRNNGETHQPPGETKIELLLKYQHQTEC